MGIALYPGSFDPITLGHLDIIRRAACLYDELVVAVLKNVHKRGAFDVDERIEMIEESCKGIVNVRTAVFDGLLVDYARKWGINTVIRGLRAANDFEYEFQMAQLNRKLCPQVETFFMMTAPEYAFISSGSVREIAFFGGDVSALVPECILSHINHKWNSRLKGGV